MEQAKWYVVHTYSGYENKVKATIEKIVENRNLQDQIQDLKIPTEEVTEIKDGVKKTVVRKKFPGYVMVKMIMNDDNWCLIRNVRGVTAFVGPASKAEPLSEVEIHNLGVESKIVKLNYSIGDSVKIKNGMLKDMIGKVEQLDTERHKTKVSVSMFGRDTLVELDLDEVEVI